MLVKFPPALTVYSMSFCPILYYIILHYNIIYYIILTLFWKKSIMELIFISEQMRSSLRIFLIKSNISSIFIVNLEQHHQKIESRATDKD
jgi:hypothetical protein